MEERPLRGGDPVVHGRWRAAGWWGGPGGPRGSGFRAPARPKPITKKPFVEQNITGKFALPKQKTKKYINFWFWVGPRVLRNFFFKNIAR
ncbi:hypothetical protein, partial [Stenotrophomonas muris]|uniref:hypothetical protein n=1 Tax=Stenotrophomonas muris TaxID=2963283 RepID=UPI00383B836E